jgi:hypothetical protein
MNDKEKDKPEVFALSITITTPAEGKPFNPNTTSANGIIDKGARMMGWQIGVGSVHMWQTSIMATTWYCQIDPFSCPTLGQSYMLTIYAWDTNGNVSSLGRSFVRS